MTTIRVLLLTNDSEYCHRITPYFAKNHPEIKLTVLNAEDGLAETLSRNMHNVLLVGEEFAGARFVPPNNTACAYLSANSSGNEINGRKSYCKYKSGETLYRMIISLFSEVSAVSETNSGANKVFAFVGANGGAGTTTIAAGFAYRMANLGKRVLFFSADKFADNSSLMSDNSEAGSLSDLIFIVKSSGGKGGNLSLKSASLLKKDASGVRFLENCKDPFDFDGVSYDQLKKMLEVVSQADVFDCIIIDGSIFDANSWRLVAEKADKIFVITENNRAASGKLTRFLNYLDVIDQRNSTNITNKTSVILNKNPAPNQNPLNLQNVSFAGTIINYNDSNTRGIAEAISRMNMWNSVCAE